MDFAFGPRIVATLMACGLAAGAAMAEEVGGEEASGAAPSSSAAPSPQELWVTSGFLSHHTAHAHRYNQHNDGLGVEWRFADDWQLNAGHYRNSVRHGSTYGQLAWAPLQAAMPLDLRLRAGASVGLIDGYPKVRHGSWFGTLVPAVMLEGSRVGLNFVYIPTVGKRVDGAYAVQLKFRVV
jgi:hypothetical protein